MIVTSSPATTTSKSSSGRFAGERATSPVAASNDEPWQPQSNRSLPLNVTVHPACVQIADSAVNSVYEVFWIKIFWPASATNAIPPTAWRSGFSETLKQMLAPHISAVAVGTPGSPPSLVHPPQSAVEAAAIPMV
jgi:hypothetical protein